MLCTNCKGRESTMHYTSIVNGIKTEHYLCDKCAGELGIATVMPFFWGDMLSHSAPMAEKNRCSACGMTPSKFRSLGMVGCEECYEELRSTIEPILRRVQKSLNHTGRTPVGFEAAKLPEPGSSAPPAQLSQKDKLKLELEKAVKHEDFEEAAKLRDKLRELEKGQNQKEVG